MAIDYYKKVAVRWYDDLWMPVQGIIIKCYTTEKVKSLYENCGERWEKIETLRR